MFEFYGLYNNSFYLFTEDDCLEVLRVIQVILPRVGGTGSSEKILNAIAHLLISAGFDIRLSICDLLDSLAISDPSVASLVIS